MASIKALDQLFAVEPPPAAKKIRELLYMAFFVTDHTTHFYALGGPDFIVGPDAPPTERNILGVVRKVGLAAGKAVIECRARNHRVIQMLGGRGIHPTAGLPGGWSKSVSEQERTEIEEAARKNVDFALFSLGVFEKVVWQNPVYRAMVESDDYCHRTYSMGTVDENNRLNFYDGQIRILDPEGLEFTRYPASEYLDHVAEHVEPWTYLKFPFLKKIGWKGFEDGADERRLFRHAADPAQRGQAASLLRAHRNSLRSSTPLSAAGSPSTTRLATHWARLIELLYAAERMLELATDPEITSPDVRAIPQRVAGIGVGSVEAPRGTLIHHYETDGKGLLQRVNLIVGTTNNHAAIAMSIRKAAERLIQAGKVVEEGMLNRIEMAFRLYDPCLSCATHSLPGSMPLEVRIRNHTGELIRTLRREA